MIPILSFCHDGPFICFIRTNVFSILLIGLVKDILLVKGSSVKNRIFIPIQCDQMAKLFLYYNNEDLPNSKNVPK